jgi:polyferredoxin
LNYWSNAREIVTMSEESLTRENRVARLNIYLYVFSFVAVSGTLSLVPVSILYFGGYLVYGHIFPLWFFVTGWLLCFVMLSVGYWAEELTVPRN